MLMGVIQWSPDWGFFMHGGQSMPAHVPAQLGKYEVN